MGSLSQCLTVMCPDQLICIHQWRKVQVFHKYALKWWFSLVAQNQVYLLFLLKINNKIKQPSMDRSFSWNTRVPGVSGLSQFCSIEKKNAKINQNRDPRDFPSLLVSHQLQTTFLPSTYQSFHGAQISGWAVNFGVTLIFVGDLKLLFIKGAKCHTDHLLLGMWFPFPTLLLPIPCGWRTQNSSPTSGSLVVLQLWKWGNHHDPSALQLPVFSFYLSLQNYTHWYLPGLNSSSAE